ncbi:MAG: iron-containing alcohol dehydrogenase [Ruminococcaceae bacterium]|nr:iron-containing alcohol dehydrogenase [Oscillospiraceae bacterium]
MNNTTIYRGANALTANASALNLGKKCLIVTGRTSAVKSGALRDVTAVLNELGIAFTVYNGITENPLYAHCREAGEMGREFGAEFVIGIGGGSPLDAAKAAATFACNPEIEEAALFDPTVEKPCLPIVAVPLTAGTGSEVNRYSVLTVGDKKKSFSTPHTLPVAAFLDPRYLRTLNAHYTVSTALDAFCHCIESYLSPKSTPESEENALRGGKLMWELLTQNDFRPSDRDAAGLTEETRMASLEGAACGGLAIKVTGTGFPHPLGYGITLRDGVPHGRACGAFIGAFVDRNMTTEAGKARLTAFAEAIGTTTDMIAAVIPALADVNLSYSDEEIASMAEKVSGAKNYGNAPYVLDDETAVEILTELVGK